MRSRSLSDRRQACYISNVMPRRSKADLNVVPIADRPYPRPLESLDVLEERAWRAIVDASPRGWIDAAEQVILRQIVTQVAIGERQATRLRKMAEAGVEDPEVERALSRAHGEAMQNTIKGMTALRATPQARERSRNVGRLFDREPPAGKRRPWEVRAPTIEAEPVDGDETDFSQPTTR